jgi:hypothetical protein
MLFDKLSWHTIVKELLLKNMSFAFSTLLMLVTAISAKLDSIVIQPGPATSQDAQMIYSTQAIRSSHFENMNFGKIKTIAMGHYDNYTIDRVLIKFDLPTNILPSQIVSAKLQLTMMRWADLNKTSGTVNLDVHKLLKSWNPGTGCSKTDSMYLGETNTAEINGVTSLDRTFGVKWNNPHVGIDDIDSEKAISATSTRTHPDLGNWNFDLTNLCKTWLTTPGANFGALIRLREDQASNGISYAYPVFYSGDFDSVPAKRPKLVIYYQSEGTPIEDTNSIIIQPGPQEAQDCDITYCIPSNASSSWQNSNTGGRDWLSIGRYDPNTVIRILIKFNLPPNINPDKISKVRLILSTKKWYDQEIDMPITLNVYQMLRSWNPGLGRLTPNSSEINGATAIERFWGNQDSTEDWSAPNVGLNDIDAKSTFDASVSKAIPDMSDWVFDITSVVKRWIAGAPNHGLIIHSTQEYLAGMNDYSHPDFFSGEYLLDPSKRPKLILTLDGQQDAKKLIAHWTFDSLSNDTIFDQINKHDIIMKNTTTAKNDIKGNAVLCTNNTFQLITRNSLADFSVPNYTVEAWVKYFELPPAELAWSQSKIFSFMTEPGYPTRGFDINLWRNKLVGTTIGTDTGWKNCYSRDSLQPNIWYHVAGSFDGKNLRVYINGKLSGTTPITGNILYPINEASIGCHTRTTGEISYRLNGLIDEIKVYNYALPDDSISQHYNSLKPADPLEINFGMKTAYAKPGDTVTMPVMLTNFEDLSISSCDMTLKFDSTKLSYLSYSIDSSMVKTWIFESIAGKDSLRFGAIAQGLPTIIKYGEGEFVRCKFLVKNTATNNDTCKISLSQIKIDENESIIVTKQNGKIIVGIPQIVYGDVTGNGEVSSLDASKVLSYTVGNLTLPDPTCPNFTKPVADVSGNGSITSYDAALILRYSLGLLDHFPVAEIKTLKKSTAALPKINDSANITIKTYVVGDAINIDLVGTNLRGCISSDIVLSFTNVQYMSGGKISSLLKTAHLYSTPELSKNQLRIVINVSDDIDDNTPVVLARISLPPPTQPSEQNITIVSAEFNEVKLLPVNISNQMPLINMPQTIKPSIRYDDKKLIIANYSNHSSVEVWALNGKLLFKQNIQLPTASSTHTINLSALRRGIYIYKFGSGNYLQKGTFMIVR